MIEPGDADAMVTYLTWCKDDDIPARWSRAYANVEIRRIAKGDSIMAPCAIGVNHSAFLLGFFGFHWARAVFMHDPYRRVGAQKWVARICQHLHLAAFREPGIPFGAEIPISAIEKHVCLVLARRVRRRFGRVAMRAIHFGYFSGLTFAALVGEDGDDRDDWDDLLAAGLLPCFEMMIGAARDIGVSDTLLVKLTECRSILGHGSSSKPVEDCTTALRSVLESLLVGGIDRVAELL